MKRNPNLPPPDQEEALIQELEALLDQENPDEACLHALLDQLDRRTGGAPLDPAEGWADLQRRRATVERCVGAACQWAVAAVVVCLAVVCGRPGRSLGASRQVRRLLRHHPGDRVSAPGDGHPAQLRRDPERGHG